MTRQKLRAAAVAAALSTALIFTSCQQFFTTSLATALARDSYDLSGISVADAVDMLGEALSTGDATMAAALVAPLFAAVSAADPGTPAYNQAASALVSAVVLSSDVGLVMSDALAAYTESLGGTEDNTLDFSSIMESVAAVELTDAEEEALILVSQSIPEDLSAADSVAAALALVGNSLDADEILATVTGMGEGGSLESEDPALEAALAFISHAMMMDPTLGALLTESPDA